MRVAVKNVSSYIYFCVAIGIRKDYVRSRSAEYRCSCGKKSAVVKERAIMGNGELNTSGEETETVRGYEAHDRFQSNVGKQTVLR